MRGPKYRLSAREQVASLTVLAGQPWQDLRPQANEGFGAVLVAFAAPGAALGYVPVFGSSSCVLSLVFRYPKHICINEVGCFEVFYLYEVLAGSHSVVRCMYFAKRKKEWRWLYSLWFGSFLR